MALKICDYMINYMDLGGDMKTGKGLIGVMGIWLTAGLMLPMVNVLSNFSSEQLLLVCGGVTALLMAVWLKGRVLPVDKSTALAGISFSLAALGLFNGVRQWGANPMAVLTTAAPIINFCIAIFLGGGRKHRKMAAGSLILIVGGVTLSLWPQRSFHFSLSGLLWGLLATAMSAMFYEAVSRARTDYAVRSFWQALPMLMLGFLIGPVQRLTALAISWHETCWLLAFALIGGVLNFLSEYWTFDNLPTELASILVQGYTPMVIVFSGLLLGEHFSMIQWVGVAVSLIGATYLSLWLAKHKPAKI